MSAIWSFHCINEEDESLINVTVLPLEISERDTPKVEENNSEDNPSFSNEVAREKRFITMKPVKQKPKTKQMAK